MTSSHSEGLAALHYKFGHVDEALRAVHESVRIAQENSDPICLHHALGWLTRLGLGSYSWCIKATLEC